MGRERAKNNLSWPNDEFLELSCTGHRGAVSGSGSGTGRSRQGRCWNGALFICLFQRVLRETQIRGRYVGSQEILNLQILFGNLSKHSLRP